MSWMIFLRKNSTPGNVRITSCRITAHNSLSQKCWFQTLSSDCDRGLSSATVRGFVYICFFNSAYLQGERGKERAYARVGGLGAMKYLFRSHRLCVSHDTERPLSTPRSSDQATLRNLDTFKPPLMAKWRSCLRNGSSEIDDRSCHSSLRKRTSIKSAASRSRS